MGLTILLFGATNGILGSLWSAIEREFGFHARESSLLFSFTFSGAIIVIMTDGYLADRFGKKRLRSARGFDLIQPPSQYP